MAPELSREDKNVATSLTEPPWAQLRPEIGDLLRPHLPEVVDELLTRIPAEVASYTRPLEGTFGEAIRQGVEVAMSRFLMLPGTAKPALSRSDRAVYEALGAGEYRQGRSLDALLAAYRVGARVSYSAFTRLGLEAGLSADELLPLGEAVFAYIDELSAVSAEGFAADQSARAGERERLRAALLAVLLGGSGDTFAINAAAAAAGWPVPAQIRAVILPEEDGLEIGARLGSETLTGLVGGVVVAVTPATNGFRRRARMRRALNGRRAFVGPDRAPEAADESLRLAFSLASAVPVDAPAEPYWLDENLINLILGREPALIEELERRLLSGLDQLPQSKRERLEETLRYWLAYRGERAAIASRLHVHPQTIGYRMTQLRKFFGDSLNDPDQRFALELLLRARQASWT